MKNNRTSLTFQHIIHIIILPTNGRVNFLEVKIMSDRYAMCPRCGRRLHRKKDIWGDWDGETYICEHCAAEADDDFEDDDE